MPASAGESRVRNPLPLQQKFEHLHLHDDPARCKSPCCSPLRPREDVEHIQSSKRPALNRNAASHLTDRSSKSVYSTGTDGSSCAQSEDSSLPSYLTRFVDPNTFEQILEMDDDEDERDFSKGIVFDFFDQAHETFLVMEQDLDSRDLDDLSAKGHFLKGSSATLGLNKVRDACEKIQHFGAMKDETGNRDLNDEQKCLDGCRENVRLAKTHFREAEAALKTFYGVDD